jgi:hypothetical protein
MTQLKIRRRRLVQGTAAAALSPALFRRAIAAEPVATVGTRCEYAHLGLSDGSQRWMVTRSVRVLPQAARDIQLVFGNFTPQKGAYEAPGPNPLNLKVELEYPEGKSMPLRFGGRGYVKLAGGALVTTDPLDVALPKGARYIVSTTVTVDEPPFKWPQNLLTSIPTGDVNVVGTDVATMSADITRPELRNQHRFGYGPYNIIGRPDRPSVSVIVLGDSVVAGQGAEDDYGDRAFVERALNVQVAWCNLAVPGASMNSFLGQSGLEQSMINHRFTHAISCLGWGDVRGGNVPRIQGHFLELWTMLSKMGCKVFQTTITPFTKSTDKWTTTEGQTPADPNFLPGSTYQHVNAWLRTVPAPLTGVFDPAALLETSIDSGIWIAPDHQPVTVDGPHLDKLGAEIATRSIDVSRLKP